jgi:23S rRNA (cytosine1962-C5)-methyltransferase
VHVRAGDFSGYALWDAVSPIALRVFSREVTPDAAWFRQRVAEAIQLRKPVLAANTNAYRLLYGEGDGVPGLTVDVYDRYAVLVTYAESLETVVPHVVRALEHELAPEGVLRRRSRGAEGERSTLLAGREPPGALTVIEHGVRLSVDLELGQKTGLFLDHRENRAFLRGHAAGARVLNLFAYTGAFSLYAALGGARRVTTVDIAAPAIAAARENFTLNDVDPNAHEFAAADVFEYLESARQGGRRFDLVICDPPSFASSRDKQRAALRAYARLHALALSVVEPGGLYAAASCTAQVSPEAFRQVLAEAAARQKLRLQLVHDAGQAFDHPVAIGHPEGRYLKFMVGRVLPRV